jgi:hypothetical protein
MTTSHPDGCAILVRQTVDSDEQNFHLAQREFCRGRRRAVPISGHAL